MDLMAARVHEAGEWVPLGPLLLVKRAGWLPLFRASPKESPSCPTTTTLVAQREEEETMQEVPLAVGPSEVTGGPLGTSQLPVVLQGEPTISCHMPQLAPPAGSFKQVSLKGFSKMYICNWCEKHASKWDSVVSHCLKKHLGGLSSLSPMWDDLFRSLKVLSPWQGDP